MKMIISCLQWLSFVISTVKSEKWMQFQRVSSFNGKVCQGTEIAFSRENVSDRSICLIECSKNHHCKSIFYVQKTGSCTGCTEIYDIFMSPTGAARGTTYYGQTVSGCPEGWFEIGSSCYTVTGVMTFEEGVETCKTMNAHPVVMETEAENTNLKTKLRLLPPTGGTMEAYFTAYTDIAIEGTWIVTGTNEPLLFDDWGINEPNLGTRENCMAFFASYDFKWVDISCTGILKTICERDAHP